MFIISSRFCNRWVTSVSPDGTKGIVTFPVAPEIVDQELECAYAESGAMYDQDHESFCDRFRDQIRLGLERYYNSK